MFIGKANNINNESKKMKRKELILNIETLFGGHVLF